MLCAVTLTVTVHVPLAAIVPPLNEMEVAPAVGVKEGAPQLVVLYVRGVATTICPGVAGNESVNETFVCEELALGLVIVKVSVLVPPTWSVDGLNALLMRGTGAVVTDTVSEQVLLVSLLSVIRLFGSTAQLEALPVGLISVPALVGVAVKFTLNEASAGRVMLPPLAEQVRILEAMVQESVPVAPPVFVTIKDAVLGGTVPEGYVAPLGRLSVSTVCPVEKVAVAAPFAFIISMDQWKGILITALPLVSFFLATDRSGTTTTIGSEKVLLLALVSFAFVKVAVFVTPGYAGELTFTLTVMTG